VKTFWLIVSGLCGVTAVLLVLLRDDYEKAFIAATAGAVAWFLSYRVRLRETLSRDDTDENT
jgi:hypothetical protein